MTAQKAAMRKIVAFCHETNSHVHLVAHPRKGQTEDKAPGKLDVAGSGHHQRRRQRLRRLVCP